MKQEKVIAHIKELADIVLPESGSLWLYGSRARGDAHSDSDYDILILLDKDLITSKDHDTFAFPFREYGWEINEAINYHLYTKKDWYSWSFTPFFKNVENDKIVLK